MGVNDKRYQEQQQEQSELITHIQKLISLQEAAQTAGLRREWFIGNAGETVTLPKIDAKTLYVDNTNNSNQLIINLDGGLGSWKIPANSSIYIPCEGAKNIYINGTGQCSIMAVNRDLGVNNYQQSEGVSIVGSLAKLSTEPFPTDGIQNGYSCLNVDTGSVFVFYNGSWWLQ